MKHFVVMGLVVTLFSACGQKTEEATSTDGPSTSTPTGGFDAEREKAMSNPYANDLGAESIPEEFLSTYPADLQKAYREVLLVKCIKCHTAARPLNSQFIEVSGSTEEKSKKVAALNKDSVIAKSPNVWQIEENIWQRYVKRMMAKPGCEISREEGKQVWNFLVYDSEQRKIGKNKSAWQKEREGLLAQFKTKYPERYKELYEIEN